MGERMDKIEGRMATLEGSVSALTSKVDGLDANVMRTNGRVLVMQGSLDALTHSIEEANRIHNDLASRMDQFIGAFTTSMEHGREKFARLEDAVDEVAPVGAMVGAVKSGISKAVGASIGKGITIGVAAVIVLVGAALLGYSAKDVFGDIVKVLQ